MHLTAAACYNNCDPAPAGYLLHALIPGVLMAKRNYTSDYELEHSVDSRGNLKTSARYTGGMYGFEDPVRAKSARRRLLAADLLAWVLALAAMYPVSVSMRTLYVSLPFAFSLLPLALMTETVILMQSREGFTHRQADRINSRFPFSSLVLFLMSAFSSAGAVLRIVISGTFPGNGDLVFMTGALGTVVCAGYSFSLRERIRCGKCPDQEPMQNKHE